jgi:hypothetical protein
LNARLRFAEIASVDICQNTAILLPLKIIPRAFMFHAFELFLKKMKAGFRRISSATKYEMDAEDLQQEAWLIAVEVAKKRGWPVDFSDPDDQNLIMRMVNFRNVKRGDWKMRRSIRIDEEQREDDTLPKWSERLPAVASSDPLVALLHRESALDAETLVAESYSQAAAYFVVFFNFKNSMDEICAYLAISIHALRYRLKVANHVVRAQPSLFDRIEEIRSDFMPAPGKEYLSKVENARIGTQWSWKF